MVANRAAGVLIVLLLFAPVPATPQQQATPQPSIRADVSVVLVPVTVTDTEGKFVSGLTTGDFRLYDDGRLRTIGLDYSESFTPISLVLAVQASDLSAPAIAKLNKIGGLIQPLVTGQRGEAAILSYADEVQVLTDFTSDPDVIVAGFRAVKAAADRAGHTVDALAEGIQMLAARPASRRRVVVLVSESRDRGSKADLWDTVAVAQRESIAIYPITYSAQKTGWTVKAGELPPPEGGFNPLAIFTELGRLGKQNAAEAMATATGGEHLSFATLRSLEKVVSRIGEELHSQYLLSFTPTLGSEDKYHEIHVQLPGHAEFQVRARPGYWPAPVSR